MSLVNARTDQPHAIVSDRAARASPNIRAVVSTFVRTFVGTFVSLVLLLPVPWMALVIVTGLAWDQVWLRIRHTAQAAQAGAQISRAIGRLADRMLKDDRNAPYLYTLIGIGTLMPVLFLASCIYQVHRAAAGQEFDWLAAFAYHVLMMGPYFRFFAYVSTLTHKEGHELRGFFKPPFRLLNHAFGRFIAVFYGHVPESYPLGHMYIHHKYDAGPEDLNCVMHLDRNQPAQFLIALREFAGYWTGLSIVGFFIRHRQFRQARRMAAGVIAYFTLIAAFMVLNFWFGFAYLLLPHLCVLIYLSAINYCWHAFRDPDHPDDEYVNSVTILDGDYNVFNEDYHVVHHLRPQLHWTENPAEYARNVDKYRAHMATIFTHTQEFELFLWIIGRRYDLMAQHFVDLSGTLTHEQKIALLKHRMQPIPIR